LYLKTRYAVFLLLDYPANSEFAFSDKYEHSLKWHVTTYTPVYYKILRNNLMLHIVSVSDVYVK